LFADDPLLAALCLIWFGGAAASLVWTAIAYRQLYRRLKRVSACGDQRLRRLCDECCHQAGVRRSIPILLFDGVQQPAVLGLFRPRLLLPVDATELNDEQLRMVMLHELAHVRHWDIAANWLLLIIRAIHWWNPVFWLAAARFQSLREQACDAFAIRRIEGQPVHGYGELLLTLAARPPSAPFWQVSLPASILGFMSSFFQKRAIGNRLKALRSAGVMRSRWHTAAIAAMIALLALCGLTDARLPETPPDADEASFETGQDVSRNYLDSGISLLASLPRSARRSV
jgi:bla regulator protein blaR1